MSKPKKQNNNLVKIVVLLNTEKHVSGNIIAQELGISRAAVWKAIKKLQSYDVPISTYKDGYKLDCRMILLNQSQIFKQIKNSKNINLEIFETIESTNQYCLDNPMHDPTKINVCLSEFQSLGKGRLGKQWLSPFGQNLCLSLSTTINTDLSNLGGLSLAISLAIVETIKQFTKNDDIKVKWPNDIIYKKQKLSGNLIQVISEQNGTCKIVIGVGINVNTDPQMESLNNINQAWTSLKEITKQNLDRNILAAKLIDNILEYLSFFIKNGFETFISKWKKHDFFFNKEISLIHKNKTIIGLEKGIDKHGHLLLEVNGTTQSYSCGETSFTKPA